jgi:ABC-type nitrate/sulfonate/bicarbonate transport system substrate-binding protein
MTASKVIVAGFIPLLDCAPLVVAAELGFAANEDIDLTLVRETSWANIRDRIVVGHFDAAHMLGPMAVASTLGIGHLRVPLIAPFSFGLGGNAITVTNALWQQMTELGAEVGAAPAVQGEALKQIVVAREKAGRPALTFAMVYPFSSHNYLLRYWLAAVGIDPDQDVRLVVLPPPLLVDAMREGQIDGFCVGEPWNSVAVSVEVGCIVAATAAIWPHSPEKVLACRADWAQRNPKRLQGMLRALHRAAKWCADPSNHAELARLLSDPRFVGAPADILRRGLSNDLVLIPNDRSRHVPGFYTLAGHAANYPDPSHALWFYSQMVRWRQVEFSEELIAAARTTYRPDLYCDALELAGAKVQTERSPHGGFFDHAAFDSANLRAYLAAYGVVRR